MSIACGKLDKLEDTREFEVHQVEAQDKNGKVHCQGKHDKHDQVEHDKHDQGKHDKHDQGKHDKHDQDKHDNTKTRKNLDTSNLRFTRRTGPKLSR